MTRLRLAMVQTNPVLGDRAGNVTRLLELAEEAYAQGAQVFLTGELAVTGYPIEDLALRDNFLEISGEAVRGFAEELEARGLGDMMVILGHPDGPLTRREPHTTGHHPARAENCASVLVGGLVVARYAKHHLPNYAVFDEFRTFLPGNESLIVRAGGTDFGIIICEDLWLSEGPVERLTGYPLGALLVLNASPVERDKDDVRQPLVITRATEMKTHVAYVNLVGGQDDLVFDGDSMIVSPEGRRLIFGKRFEEDLIVADLELPESDPAAALPENTVLCEVAIREAGDTPLSPRPEPLQDDLEILWHALVTGTRDYCNKNGFPSVILGLSGGIDSAVSATIAVDALGATRVFGVSMPSVHSSDHSAKDAVALATAQNIPYRVESIAEVVALLDKQLELTGLAAENVQSRARAIILMALSNKEGHLVLTTGNKSELAVGYSTIYGDSVGGFAPLKDVPKTLVWELARWRNATATSRGETPPIPLSSIEKAPSAELRPNQTDQDSLPDYEILDQILEFLVVKGLDSPAIVAEGFERELVEQIVDLVSRAEWKRRQGAVGPRISSVAFGRDRRLPITSRLTPYSPPR